MFETFGFDTVTAPQAAVYTGLILGVVFGILAQITRFCFRRAITGDDRKQAAGVWMTALALAILGTQFAVLNGWIGFEDHRFMATDLPVAAIVFGGLIFGAGMVLTRGCVSRLSVLTGSGNLRAALVLVVFAVVAHATLKGVLAPIRTTLGGYTVALDSAALPFAGPILAVVLATLLLTFATRSGARATHLALAAMIGLVAAAGWVATGFVLYDDFDPIALESLSFTSPAAETLFWGVASSSISPTFGTGMLGGVIAGAAISALIRGEFKWQSFDSPRQTGRYLAGAALMGVGGVLAGGCTVGAGLSGVPTLSFAAVLALLSIAAGGWTAARLLSASSSEPAGSSTTPPLQPAE
ncbi:putative inner membrane protein [Thalassovita gelatinovora]|uniref:Putative inner membrane protein n=1 Tax=Thalassovita gelatinovora TaxID=53501 RepID=A0A0P1G3X4_THAGE|nr:YeeE/YedE family protein [Thalassovita gelatinovora]QIZ79869.1 YeeE/YedE family protein [Thalassovita gelatinovora]CUH66974.1 putative inner membrane protein [Thalassovita gelatinovora]SEQ46044.1 Sulphur transport [Thalassovita gelatinovora]